MNKCCYQYNRNKGHQSFDRTAWPIDMHADGVDQRMNNVFIILAIDLDPADSDIL